MTDLDQRIATLREELRNVTGTPTEVYVRIVGYYRPVANWNPGKKSEYADRVTFAHVPKTVPDVHDWRESVQRAPQQWPINTAG